MVQVFEKLWPVGCSYQVHSPILSFNVLGSEWYEKLWPVDARIRCSYQVYSSVQRISVRLVNFWVSEFFV